MITNEQVLDMVRNTLLEEGLEDQLKEAIFEPRLTRAKIKKALEKGNVSIVAKEGGGIKRVPVK